MSVRRAVVLVGSAKPGGSSTSESLAAYLAGCLESAGAAVDIVSVVSTKAAPGAARLAKAVEESDLFVLATPLYVDSLPYLVTRAFERLAAARAAGDPSPCAFAAIVNCGFPEASQCHTALAIARAFARRAGFTWAGGLALGEGGLIAGRPLAKSGPMLRHVRAALDAAAAALSAGDPIPQKAAAAMARPLIPPSLYTLIADVGWKLKARHNSVSRSLDARPFDH